MRVTASMDRFRADAFAADLRRLVGSAIEATARQVPLDLSRRIYAQVDPDNASQRRNLPATAKQKARKYGHSIPLLAEGVLADPSLYRVRISPELSRISPPIQRALALVRLDSLGYRIWGISGEVREYLAAALTRVVDYLDSRRDAYVERAAR